MHPAVIILTLLVAVLLLVSWLRRSPSPTVPPALKQALLVGAIALLALLSVRLHWGFALLALALPLLQRMQAISRVLKSATGPTPGQSSDVETDFLHMSIDHDTGVMTGEVRAGRHRGRRVPDLSLEELLELYEECERSDPDAASILETYLDRHHEADWRDRWSQGSRGRSGGEPGGSGADGMTRAQALEILGLSPDASEADIIEAHRRLMQKVHPDRGGSSYLAAQLNRAKDLLLDS